MQPTDIFDPEYFHKVVDCQWACPAHTPVPEYIRLIAQRRYTEAFLINWESNVFPGILGRTCDRPCEPACRRGRVEQKPVAICRLKRAAADNKGDVSAYMPAIPAQKNGKKIALIGGGPASLTVARDLMPLGYHCVLFEKDPCAGGLMRTNIPSFRLPEAVLDEEVDRIVDFGVETRFGTEVTSLKAVLKEGFDAVFIGTGAPKGKELDIPGRAEADANIHIGIDWLTGVAFEHIEKIGKRVVVIGGGNTAMDCCRTALRLGGKDVRVTVRSPRADMKASDWEIEEAEHEGVPIFDNHTPLEFVHENGKLKGVLFQKVFAEYDANGKRSLIPTGEAPVLFECDDVLLAIGQDNAFPWIERDIGLEFDEWGLPVVDRETFASTLNGVFFGGDAAWGPENIIWAVAHGHQAAISIDLHCRGELLRNRPAPGTTLVSQKMGIHEWSYDNDIANTLRVNVPHADKVKALTRPEGGGRARLRRGAGLSRGDALPELRRADRVPGKALHRMRCVHGHLPGRLHQLHRKRRGDGAALTSKGAGAQPGTEHLCVEGAEDGAHHGQGRGRVPALRTVRGAVPDRGLGHAEVHLCRRPCQRKQDIVLCRLT